MNLLARAAATPKPLTTDDEIPLAITAWLGFAQIAILDWIDNQPSRANSYTTYASARCAPPAKLPTPREAP